MNATLMFEGCVAVDVPVKERHGHYDLTTTIGGDDVLAVVHEATLGMRKPVQAAVSIGNDAPIVGPLRVDRGTNYGCDDECGCFHPAELGVGGTDVLEVLAVRHDEDTTVNVTLIPAPEPVQRIVAVEFAHHVTYADQKFRPLDVIELPASQAQRLTTEGGITRESAEAAGLHVAPMPEPWASR